LDGSVSVEQVVRFDVFDLLEHFGELEEDLVGEFLVGHEHDCCGFAVQFGQTQERGEQGGDLYKGLATACRRVYGRTLLREQAGQGLGLTLSHTHEIVLLKGSLYSWIYALCFTKVLEAICTIQIWIY